MSSIGRLLQPYVEVKWGDLNLSDWDYGDNINRPVVYNVTVDLEIGDSQVNKASFEFDPSPIGFKAYVQCTGEKYTKEPITITFGYENGSKIETTFFYQNVDFVTGKTQKIQVYLAGLHKSKLTSHWWNKYMGDGKKDLTVKEIFNELAKKVDMKVKYDQEAEKIIKDLPKIKTAVLHNQTLGSFMVSTAKKYGLGLEYPTGSADDHKTILVRARASVTEEKLKVSEKDVSGKIDVGAKRLDKRMGFIVGPTLVTEISRKTNPFAVTGPSADTEYEIRVTGDKDPIEGTNPTEEQPVTQSSSPPSGSTTTPQKSNTGECRDKKGVALKGDALKKCRAKIKEKEEKKAEGELSEMGITVFMVPYMVGVKPYDFIIFPSLKGDWVEDWEVHSVSYQQSGGAISLSISGKRPQVGQGNLLLDSEIEKYVKKVSEFKTLLDYEKYYWNIV